MINTIFSKIPFGVKDKFRMRLFNLVSGWKLNGSMIEFKRNLKLFFINYAHNVCSQMNIRFSRSLRKSTRKLGFYMEHIQKHRGINQCILRLKVSSIVVLHYISGNPVKHTNDLGQRIRIVNGLPAWLPSNLRSLIRSKSLQHIRLLVSLLSSYKGMKGIYKDPDLSSITAPKFFKPMKGEEDLFALSGSFTKVLPWDMLSDNSEVLKTRNLFWRLYNRSSIPLSWEIDSENLPLTLKSGPNSPVAFLGAAIDAVGHLNKGEKSPLLSFVRYMRRNDDLGVSHLSTSYARVIEIMSKVATDTVRSIRDSRSVQVSPYNIDHISMANIWANEKAKKATSAKDQFKPIREAYLPGSLEYLVTHPEEIKLGKLAIKLEAAGKVRVFAIVDYWTQVLLEPIHKSMFKILRLLPMDATFDQLGAVENFMKTDHSYIASFDLKSATDLIPQMLYEDVLAPWFDPTGKRPLLSKKWMSVLVDRDFHFEGKVYRYSRGQPMGALSSWASLAIIHHYLVFLAALRVNLVGFGDYLVLGDDIVIGNKLVADSYLAVCRDYGITVGLPKSFQSNNSFFQFASQDVLGQTNISPISLKEVLSITQCEYHFQKFKAVVALGPRVEFANRLVRKGFVENTIMSTLRTIMSYRDWSIVSRSLSKGKIPRQLVPMVISLLTSGVKLEVNKFSISQLMGALRGDIRMLTGNKEYSMKEQNFFVSRLVEELGENVEVQAANAMNVVAQFGRSTLLATHPLGMVFSDSIGSRTTQYLLDIRRVQKTWSQMQDQVLADIEHNKIVYLILEEKSPIIDAHISYFNIHKIFELLRDLESISANLDLYKEAIDTIKSGHSPKKAKVFMSFTAKYGERGQSAW